MSKFSEIDIPLTKLILDVENSRQPRIMDSQREVVEWMSSGDKKIGEKIYALAKDIVEHGLNPSERVMVKSNDDDSYTVLEGNRRVTALKLLSNPATAPDVNRWKQKYAKLKGTPNFTPLKKIPCVIVDDEETALHFMEIKHLGELNGVGVVTWGAEEKARHQQRRNRTSKEHKALSLLEYVKSSDLFDEATKEKASQRFPITSLDRLLSDKSFREFMGLNIGEEGDLEFSVEPKEAAKPIKKIINDLGDGGTKNVRDIINKTAREIYKNTFFPSDKANQSKKIKDKISLKEASSNGKKPISETNPGTKKVFQYEDPKNRKHLIIQGTSMPIDPKKYNRLRRIFEELRRLPLQSLKDNSQAVYPNAIAVLFRSFLEMSIDAFIEKNKITSPNPKGWEEVNLNERLKIVKSFMQANNLMTKDQLNVINKITGNTNKLASINTLNNYVHNRGQTPPPSDLIDIWDTYTDLLSCIWENLKTSN